MTDDDYVNDPLESQKVIASARVCYERSANRMEPCKGCPYEVGHNNPDGGWCIQYMPMNPIFRTIIGLATTRDCDRSATLTREDGSDE